MHRDVAQQFKISYRLVVDLVREAKKQPGKLLDLKLAEQERAQTKQAIEEAVTERLANNMQIVRVQQIQSAVARQTGLEVSLPKVR